MTMDDAASYWSPLLKMVPLLRCWTRTAWRDGASMEEGQWGQMLIMPVAGYLEASDGPIPIGDIGWVEVSATRLKGGIAGVPLQMIDASEEILAQLQETQLDWELREGMWTVEGILENQPIKLFRVENPFKLAPTIVTASGSA